MAMMSSARWRAVMKIVRSAFVFCFVLFFFVRKQSTISTRWPPQWPPFSGKLLEVEIKKKWKRFKIDRYRWANRIDRSLAPDRANQMANKKRRRKPVFLGFVSFVLLCCCVVVVVVVVVVAAAAAAAAVGFVFPGFPVIAVSYFRCNPVSTSHKVLQPDRDAHPSCPVPIKTTHRPLNPPTHPSLPASNHPQIHPPTHTPKPFGRCRRPSTPLWCLLGFLFFNFFFISYKVSYRVLSGFTGLPRVAMGFTGFSIGYYWVLWGFFYSSNWVLLGCKRFYWVLLGFSLVIIGFYEVLSSSS